MDRKCQEHRQRRPQRHCPHLNIIRHHSAVGWLRDPHPIPYALDEPKTCRCLLWITGLVEHIHREPSVRRCTNIGTEQYLRGKNGQDASSRRSRYSIYAIAAPSRPPGCSSGLYAGGVGQKNTHQDGVYLTYAAHERLIEVSPSPSRKTRGECRAQQPANAPRAPA
jgi:hypothetical protein